MPNVSSSNTPHLGATSLTMPQTQRYNTTDEAVFLQQQAADAQVAMHQTLAEMQETAKAIADVRRWTQQYPWVTVGVATMLGFLAASVLTKDGAARPQAEAAQPGQAAKPSLFASLVSSLVTMVRGAIMSAVVSGVMDKVNQQEHMATEGD